MKLNRNSFYILLLDDLNQDVDVVNLIRKIRLIDYDGKIAIIYKRSIDVADIYIDLGLYDIYMFVLDNYEYDAFTGFTMSVAFAPKERIELI